MFSVYCLNCINFRLSTVNCKLSKMYNSKKVTVYCFLLSFVSCLLAALRKILKKEQNKSRWCRLRGSLALYFIPTCFLYDLLSGNIKLSSLCWEVGNKISNESERVKKSYTNHKLVLIIYCLDWRGRWQASVNKKNYL